MARRRKTQMELPVAADADAGAQVAGDVLVEASVAAPVREWRVPVDSWVSLFGQMTLLPAGSVVSAALYGPDGVARLKSQVALEPVA